MVNDLAVSASGCAQSILNQFDIANCFVRCPALCAGLFLREAANQSGALMAEEFNYKGYRLLIGPVRKGWRAAIFPPGSARALPESPATLEKSPKEAIVAEAQRIVDELLATRNK